MAARHSGPRTITRHLSRLRGPGQRRPAHLRAGSLAIDYCANYFYTPTDQGIDGQTRGSTTWGWPTISAPYDIGADEVIP